VPAGYGFYYQSGSSPYYWFPGNFNNGNIVLNDTNGWPPTNISGPPSTLSVNGEIYTANSMSPSTSGDEGYGSTTYYQGPGENEYVQIGWNLYDGIGQTSYIWGSVGANSEWFSTTLDPNTLQIGAGVPGDIALSFVQSTGSPAQGPSSVSWDDTFLSFIYTSPDGKDYYWAPADANGECSAVVAPGDSVLAVHGSESLNGTYNPTPGAFNFSGAADSGDIIALNLNGVPYAGELPVGLTVQSGSNGPGQQILGGSGTSYTPPAYTYEGPGGTWGVKFVSIPDGVYLVQDENGNYTAPPYSFVGEVGDTTVNAISGWPVTNIYPPYLYVNGSLCTLNAASEADSGGNPSANSPRTGSASYTTPANEFTVTLAWTWTSQFQGTVQISYGPGSTFSGTWNGLSIFAGLPSGFTAATTPPTSGPQTGPPQITLNGVRYTYSSSLSGSNNSQNADVYVSPSGQQQISISPTGATTITRANGTTVAGTYNSATQSFNFGDNNIGSIAALDSTGRPMTTLINGGGTTNFNGGLDVQGNTFSLGTWMNGSESVYGFALTYADAPTGTASQLGLATTRSAVNWLWAHPSTDGGTDQVISMVLDNAHRLLLYNPTAQTAPAVMIDPANAASFQIPVRVQPAGDINMGTFQAGPQPGQ